jgi:hypothetical protein
MAIEKWLRFEHAGKSGFGKLQGDTITVYQGEMFQSPVRHF